MTTPAYIPTGKRNMLSSLAYYLRQHLVTPAVEVIEDQYHQAQKFPCISVVDGALFGLGETAFNRDLGDGKVGKIEQTQVEFNCMDLLTATNRGARQQALNLRDRLKHTLEYAGSGEPGGLPPIPILDFEQNPPVNTGAYLWHPSEVSAAWNEAYIANEDVQPGVKRYRIYARIYWQELKP